MADGRKNNGGVRSGAGRPGKADEQKLIEKLTPLAAKAYKALEDGLDDGNNWAVKMWFEYMYGRPKEKLEVTQIEETPIIQVE